MQITTLIMAPVFFSAYNYILLGQAITALGPVYSILRPGWYFAVFLVADLVSLILQAVGGGQAASSAATAAPTDSATNIMVAGIIFQLISMGVFVVLGVDFVVRRIKGRPYTFRQKQMVLDEKKAQVKREKKAVKAVKGGKTDEKSLKHVNSDAPSSISHDDAIMPARTDTDMDRLADPTVSPLVNRWWILLAASLFSSLAIITRGIYRSIELNAGWESELMQTEILQALLDGLMMVLAVGVFNFANPAHLLPQKKCWGSAA